MQSTIIEEVPIQYTHAARVRAKRRELAQYVARTRARRDTTFVRGYYRAPRRPKPSPWADVIELCVLVPVGAALAAYAMSVGFGS